MYLDGASKAPITFIVNAVNEKSNVTKLSNEIIVHVIPTYSYTRPAYFEKPSYLFELKGNQFVIFNSILIRFGKYKTLSLVTKLILMGSIR